MMGDGEDRDLPARSRGIVMMWMCCAYLLAGVTSPCDDGYTANLEDCNGSC